MGVKNQQIMKAQKHLGIAALILTAITSPLKAQVFDYEYTGDYLPTDPLTVPAWQEPLAPKNTTASASGGILTIASTALDGYLFYRQTPSESWNGALSLGSTIEFVLRVDSQLQDAGFSQSVGIFTGTHAAVVVFTSTSVVNGAIFGNFASYALDTSNFHTYRFTTTNTGLLSLYVDNDPTAAFAVQMEASTGNYMEFGATTAFGGGTVEWDSVRWTNDGAFAPVPEPATLALLGLTSLLIIPLRRRLQGKLS